MGDAWAAQRKKGGKESIKARRWQRVQSVARSSESGKGGVTKVENHLEAEGKESMRFRTESNVADGAMRPTRGPIQSIFVPGE